MLGDISGVNAIYLICGYTDMRKSIDGLITVIQEQLRMDPRSKALFLFCGDQGTSVRRRRVHASVQETDFGRKVPLAPEQFGSETADLEAVRLAHVGVGDRAAEGDQTAHLKVRFFPEFWIFCVFVVN